MSPETPHHTPLFKQTLDRFSKLNAAGRSSFIARLIDTAKDRPLLAQEIRNALHRIKTDSHLAICREPAQAAAA